MRNLLIILLFLLITCKSEPEFYIDGKPYYTQKICVKDTTYQKFELHYGYYFGKYQLHTGYHTVTECLEYKTDTIEIKP